MNDRWELAEQGTCRGSPLLRSGEIDTKCLREHESSRRESIAAIQRLDYEAGGHGVTE
jgi:hypothetical protein